MTSRNLSKITDNCDESLEDEFIEKEKEVHNCVQSCFHLKKGAMRTGVMSLIASAIGASLFTMPYGMRCSGIILGTAMLLYTSIIGGISLYVLINSVKRYKCETYSSLAQYTVSSTLGFFVDIAISLNGLLAGTAFLIFLADFSDDLLTLVYKSIAAPQYTKFRRATIIIAGCLITLPLSIQSGYGKIRKYTAIYVVGVLVTVAIVVCKTPEGFYTHFDNNQSTINMINLDRTTYQSFNIFLYGFMQHQNAISICQDMTDNTLHRSKRIAIGTIVTECIFYLILSLCGYFSFQSNTDQNFINNYSKQDTAIIVCRIFMTVCSMFAMPMGMISTGVSLRILYHKCKLFILSIKQRCFDFQHLDALNEPANLAEPLVRQKATEQQNWLQKTVFTERFFSIVAAYCIEIFVALKTQQIAVMLSVVGGILSVCLMTLIPTIIFLKGIGRDFGFTKKITICTSLLLTSVFGISFSVASVLV